MGYNIEHAGYKTTIDKFTSMGVKEQKEALKQAISRHGFVGAAKELKIPYQHLLKIGKKLGMSVIWGNNHASVFQQR